MQRRHALIAAASGLAAPALLAGRAGAQQAPAAPDATAAAPPFHRAQVGNRTLTLVHDGYSRRTVDGLVRNAPAAAVQAAVTEARLPPGGTELDIPFTVPVLDTGDGLVMFDTGTGAQLVPTAGRLADNMRAAGLDPARVRTVVISHFHADHITGLTTRENEAVFPNAEVLVPAAEWAWWTDEGNEARTPEGQRGTFANARRRFGPYAGKVRRFEDADVLLPGVRAVAAYGHTPGHTAFQLGEGADQVMLVADATNRPELFARHPGWHVVFDIDPVAAEASRRRIFDRVVQERMRVAGYHFPAPALGRMERDGDGYRFLPAA